MRKKSKEAGLNGDAVGTLWDGAKLFFQESSAGC